MQDYKLVVRSMSSGASQVDAQTGQVISQNAGEFMAYLNEMYLGQGYTIHSIQLLRTFGEPVQYEFAYHLVKEYQSTKVSK